MAIGTILSAGATLLGAADDLFGRKDDSAQKKTAEQNRLQLEYLKRANEQIRRDASNLYGPAQQARRTGFGGAMDMLSGTIPELSRVARQGNLNAQQTSLAGLKQANNAILGMPVNYQALQAQAVTPDLSMFQRENLPQVQYTDPAEITEQLQEGRGTTPGMTNAEVLENARNSGKITDYDYYAINYLMNKKGYSNPSSKHWSKASSEDLISSIPEWVHSKARESLVRFFTNTRPEA